MKTIIFSAILLLSLPIFAQNTFQRTYGNQGLERGYQIIIRNENEIYLLGLNCNWDSLIGCTGYSIRLIEIDSSGKIIRDKSFVADDGPAWISNARMVLVNDGILIGAERYDLNDGAADFLLIKLNSILDTMWTRTYTCTGPIPHRAFLHDVVTTHDRGFLLVGEKNNPGVAAEDVFILKTDSNGVVEWSRTCGEQGYFNSAAYSVKEVNDGGFVMAGMTQSFGAGEYDIYMLKLDSEGNVLWTKTFGSNTIEMCFDLVIAPDHGFLLTGYTTDFSYNSDLVILKTDSNGNMNWIKSYGGDDAAVGNSILVNPDSSIIVVGNKGVAFADQDDVYAIKTDFNGNLEWAKTYGGIANDNGADVVETSTGFFICGSTRNFSHGLEDFYLLKIDNNGNLDCNIDTPLTITQSPTWVQGSGGTESSGYIGTSREIAIVDNDTASYDACSCVSPSAKFFWSYNGGYQINFFNQETWAGGWLWNFGDGDTSSKMNPQHTYPDTGTYVACLSVFSVCGADTFCDSIHIEAVTYYGIDEHLTTQSISVFPNPVIDNATIKLGSYNRENLVLSLYTNFGIRLWSTQINSDEPIHFERKNLPAGLYILELTSDGLSKKIKLMIQ